MNLIVAGRKDQFPETNKLLVTFIGRSNQGKSTLINSLLRKKMAYVSKMPGKTQTINFYEEKDFFLVDLPGYGYAKKNEEKIKQMSKLISNFLDLPSAKNIIHVCSIIAITEQDIEAKNFFNNSNNNYLLILNKTDKLGNSQKIKAIKKIKEITRLGDDQILDISAKKGINIAKLKKKINEWILKNKKENKQEKITNQGINVENHEIE